MGLPPSQNSYCHVVYLSPNALAAARGEAKLLAVRRNRTLNSMLEMLCATRTYGLYLLCLAQYHSFIHLFCQDLPLLLAVTWPAQMFSGFIHPSAQPCIHDPPPPVSVTSP